MLFSFVIYNVLYTNIHSLLLEGSVLVALFFRSMRDNKHALVTFRSGKAERTCEEFYLQAGHTSIYTIKSQGRQVYYWTFEAVTDTEE